MTQPPSDPTAHDASADASPTEPVPVVTAPSGLPTSAAPEPTPGSSDAAPPANPGSARAVRDTGTVEAVDAEGLTITTGSGLTITTESGLTVTVGLDGTTTYHQGADAQASDVTVGTTVEVSVAGRFRPRGGSDDELTLGTASDVTIAP